MRKILLPLFFTLIVSNAYASCGSSFCSVNTHWDTQGLSHTHGWLIDLRYSYANANKLRAGSSKISPDAPTGSDTEIENKRTINQILNVSAEYTVSERWNVAIAVPVVMRDHMHTFDSSGSGALTQQAEFTEIGDVRLIGRYNFDLGSMTTGSGVRFGFKLPTGAIDKVMTPPDPANPSVPYKLERSSQPGTGSADVILGAYYYSNFPGSDWGWFMSGQMQSEIATQDSYKPGREVSLDIGAHYAITPDLNILLQLNGQHKERDRGTNANVASGGYSVALSPGLSYSLTHAVQLYTLGQVAIKQYVNTDPADAASGQLTVPWSVTAGISYRF